MSPPGSPRPSLSSILRDMARVLRFERPSQAVAVHWPVYLLVGLGFTWLAGVGRYWDNPRAGLFQHLGLGSVVYVFVLAFIVWALLLPLRPRFWFYRNVLVFVTMTSPPALLYAVPVERFLPLDLAQSTNAIFLAFVAAWRVGLLVWFLRRVAGLTGVTVGVATLLPLSLILVTLTALNLEHVVFQLMAGNGPDAPSGNDVSYAVVAVLAYLSVLASPVLLVVYGWLAWRAYTRALEEEERSSAGGS